VEKLHYWLNLRFLALDFPFGHCSTAKKRKGNAKEIQTGKYLLILLKSAGRILAGSLCNRTKQTKLEMLQEKCNNFLQNVLVCRILFCNRHVCLLFLNSTHQVIFTAVFYGNEPRTLALLATKRRQPSEDLFCNQRALYLLSGLFKHLSFSSKKNDDAC